MNKISDKAHIDPNARIGKNVTIYPFAYIEGDVVIGDNCIIYPRPPFWALTLRTLISVAISHT